MNFRRAKILPVIFLVATGNCMAQVLSQQVLVPAAGLVTSANLLYSQTIGETAVEIIGPGDYLITQGFQQPRMKFENVKEKSGIGVNVYPNPVSDYVIIELFGESAMTFRIEILNITGTVVFSEQKIFYDKFLYDEKQDVSNLIRGFYIIRVICKNPMINRSFKIEKI